MSLIDPNLLQLIGLGSSGDPDIADGRHLRWIFHRLLGFPRSGFRLIRRPSLLTINFDQPPAGTPAIRSQLMRRIELGNVARLRFPSGLTVSKGGGFVFGPAASGGQPLLRIDSRPVSLDFGVEGTPPPTSGDLLSNPAAYVLLTITRRLRTGYVIARGYYNARPALRLVDRAAVGDSLRVHVADLAADVSQVGSTFRVLSSGERVVGPQAVIRRDTLIAASLARLGLRPTWSRPSWIADANPFVTQTLLLHGALLEHIDLRGHDANLLQVRWVTSRDLLATPGWTELGRFYLPLTDSPDIYPAWTAESGDKIAATRLFLHPPKRQAPWDRESGGDPPTLLPTVPASVTQSLETRYLGSEFEPVHAAMREFLHGELLQVVPQCMVQVTERLEPEPGDDSGPEPLDMTVSPFDLLYGASADPQIAHALGLATVDAADPDGVYDYAIEAGFPLMWVQWIIQPKLGRDRAERLKAELNGRLADWNNREAFRGISIASLLTGLKQAPAVKLEAPADLRAEVIPDATHVPVQARVQLTWERGPANLFEDPHRVRVLHTFKRASGPEDLLLHHRDDESKLLVPHMPTPHGKPLARLNLVDRSLPEYGLHTWKVAAMDLFGRLSPDSVVTEDVHDTLAPPSPANVELALLGDAASGPAWTRLVIKFDWLPAQAAVAPDLSRFELHLRQGLVGAAEEALPATWGKFETTPGAFAGPVEITWPSLTPGAVPPGVTIQASGVALTDGGTRITVEVSPVVCPFDASGYAHLAGAVRALDNWENPGGFSVGRAERADLSVPPPPPFSENALRSTLPDAQNRSWYRVPVPTLPGASIRVLRASSVALLSAAGTSAMQFAGMSEPDQVGLLKALAVTHRDPFATDHEQPIPANGGAHLLELAGFDRGYTVIHVAIENRTGTRSAWPTDPSAFLVVAVPRGGVPPAPLVRDVRVGDRTVTLWVAPDVTGTTRSVAVYRTRKAVDADDVRRMKPVAQIALPQPAPDEAVPLIDSGLYDEVEYFYRVVAIGENGLRSQPSVALSAMPVAHGPPPAPEVMAIERISAQPDKRRIRLLVPRRDYRVFLFRRRRYAAAWERPTNIPVTSDGALDFGVLPATSDPAGYQVIVEDTVSSPDDGYAYFARIEDRRGRGVAGPPLLESP